MAVDSTGAASDSTPRAIAEDAYFYAFAMLENYDTVLSRRPMRRRPEYVGGFGRYRHYSEPFTPENKDIVTPNNDTPYSWAWLDLRRGAVGVERAGGAEGPLLRLQWSSICSRYNMAYVGSARHRDSATGDYHGGGAGLGGGDAPTGSPRVFPRRDRHRSAYVGAHRSSRGTDDMANVRQMRARIR